MYLLERTSYGEIVRLLLTVGLLGAFTTFSTYSMESIRLLEQGALGMAAGNVFGQVVICLVLTWVGIQLARII